MQETIKETELSTRE